jgi:hypothetical protein
VRGWNQQICKITELDIWLGHCDVRARVAKPGQFADVHDSFVELLRTIDFRTILSWIGEAAGMSLHDVGHIHERSPTIAVLGFLRPARKAVADLVLSVFNRRGLRLASLILELQLSRDRSKRWIWPLLATGLAAETRRRALVVVFSPDPTRRAWMRGLLPQMEPQPLVIEPDQIPLICDVAKARLRPREAIFAALYHARETDEAVEMRVAGIRAAVIAIRTLDHLEQLRYGDLVWTFTPSEIMQRALEELLESGELDEAEEPVLYRDGYAYVKGEQDGREAGRAEGREEGREEALAQHRDTLRHLLVDILDARGTPLTSQARGRIEQCDDADRLTRWCSKAVTWTGSIDALLDDSAA